MFCSNEDLLISIQDAANQVVNEYGEDVAKSVFQRFGATCAEDLNPSDYEAVFSELYQIANDNYVKQEDVPVSRSPEHDRIKALHTENATFSAEGGSAGFSVK